MHAPVGIMEAPEVEPSKEHQYFTLKGRLEMRKDYKGVLWAASQTPGIGRVEYSAPDFTVSCSWSLTHDHLTPEESLQFTCEYVDTFISNLKLVYEGKVDEFKGMGIEPHVFIESLKPIDEYDGARNGPWEDFKCEGVQEQGDAPTMTELVGEK